MARHLIQNAATGDTRIVGDAALPFFPGYVIRDTLEDGIPEAVFYGAGESDLRYVNVSELSDPESAASVALRAAFVSASQLVADESTTATDVNAWLAAPSPFLIKRLVGEVTLSAPLTVPSGTHLDCTDTQLSTAPGVTGSALIDLGAGAKLIGATLDGSAATPAYFINVAAGASVLRCTVRNSTGYGVHVVDADGVTVADNIFEQVDGYSILIEGACARTRVANNRIRHTTAGKGQGVTIKGLAGVPTDTVVIGNFVDVRGTIGLEAQELAHGTTFTGNVVRHADIGISASRVLATTITGNTVSDCTVYGIEAAACDGFTINANTVDCGELAGASGIVMSGVPGSTHGTIAANTVVGIAADGNGIRGAWPTPTQCSVAINGNSLTGVGHFTSLSLASAALIVGNVCDGQGVAVASVELESCTDALVANNVAHAFTGACINAYGGPMTNITHGPNLLSGGTPTQLINGPLGAGSRDLN